jgi:hypothetical protein
MEILFTTPDVAAQHGLARIKVTGAAFIHCFVQQLPAECRIAFCAAYDGGPKFTRERHVRSSLLDYNLCITAIPSENSYILLFCQTAHLYKDTCSSTWGSNIAMIHKKQPNMLPVQSFVVSRLSPTTGTYHGKSYCKRPAITLD